MDWTGTSQSLFATLGSSSHSERDRETHDFYATEPRAVELLCDLERFHPVILEPACGKGHIAEVLTGRGYAVIAEDLIDRGYGKGGVDFLSRLEIELLDLDIITNPPYALAQRFVEKSLEIVKPGRRVAMFLKLTFLEGQNRRKLFELFPPELIYVSSSRLVCSLNGTFEEKGSAACYAWFIWRKGFKGEPRLRWFN